MQNVDIFVLSGNQPGWIQDANSDQPLMGCSFYVSSVANTIWICLAYVPSSGQSKTHAMVYPLVQVFESWVDILLKIRTNLYSSGVSPGV